MTDNCSLIREINKNKLKKRFYVRYLSKNQDYGCETTSIVFDDTLFFILNGNHLAIIASILRGSKLEEEKQLIFNYFLENEKKANPFSAHFMVVGFKKDCFHLRELAIKHLGLVNIKRLDRVCIFNLHS